MMSPGSVNAGPWIAGAFVGGIGLVCVVAVLRGIAIHVRWRRQRRRRGRGAVRV